MKKRLMILLLASSAAAAAVRLLQQVSGFEPNTGLPVHALLYALPLAALLLIWLLAVRKLPADDVPVFPRDFPQSKNSLFLPVAGVFLLALSGLGWLFFGLLPQSAQAITADGTLVSVLTTGPLSFRSMVLLGVLHLALAVCLFPAVAACRVREEGAQEKPFNSTLLMIVPVLLVVRLVLLYRVHSINPVVSQYAAELLAMVCLTLAFYRLAGFCCGVGSSRRFSLYAGWAVMLSLTALAAGQSLPDMLFYPGAALVLLGQLWPRLEH